MPIDFNDPNWQKSLMEAHRADQAARDALLAKPANATYGTHEASGLNDKPWQIETTYKNPGNRRQYSDSLKASGISGSELTKAMSEYQFKKEVYQAQEQRNQKSMISANRGGTWSPRTTQVPNETKKDYSGSGVPTAHTGGSQAMPTSNDSLKNFLQWSTTPEGKAWSDYQQNANPANPNQPSWVPEGYTLYGDDKTGVTLPTGANVFDAMNRGGFNATGAYGGTPNPYFPNGPVSNGNLSLGGSPAETANPPTTGLYAPPKPPASGAEQSTGSGAPNNDQLKAFLEYLAGRAGNASPIVGQAQQQPAYTARPQGPAYGAVVQKGLL